MTRPWSLASCLVLASALLAGAEAAQATRPTAFGVAVVGDGPSARWQPIDATFRRELTTLTAGEFELRFVPFEGAWSRRSILDALDRAYADPSVDLVLVTGLMANQLAAGRDHFPEPTFLPVVLDAEVVGLPRRDAPGAGSGVPNLAYLADELSFGDDLDDFARVVELERVALLVDAILLDLVGDVADTVRRMGAERGVEVVPVPFDDPDGDLAARVPGDVDGVLVAGLPRLDDDAVDRLVEGLIERRLPSFSLAGDRLVRRGLLMSGGPESDWQRLARRNALAMQAVMLGERPEDQGVGFEAKRRLHLNLATARAIGLWPRFDVLVEAELLEEDPAVDAPPLDLAQVAREAVDANLDLLAQRHGTDAGLEDVREARAALRPQLEARLSVVQLDGAAPAVAGGLAAQRSTAAELGLSQVVFSDSARANVDVQRLLQASREAELEGLRLDVVQLATLAFLDVLRTDTQVRIQRDNLDLTRTNLELARDRVRLGSASAADVYRWQSQLATARRDAVDAWTARLRARENLQRILHRPLGEPVRLVPTTLEGSGLLIAGGEIEQLVDSPGALRATMTMLVGLGLERSPELLALRALIDAKARELRAARRAFTFPTAALQGEVSRVLEEDRAAGASLEGEDDWSLGLVASLPLWSGGARRARVARAELELEELETRYQALRDRVEQAIRSDMYLANASYLGIGLAREAAEAAAKNLELITDAYSQGAVSILELLDAQSAALRADEAASTAVYEFLIDLLNVQRSAGRFDFFLDDAERRAILERLRIHLRDREPPP